MRMRAVKAILIFSVALYAAPRSSRAQQLSILPHRMHASTAAPTVMSGPVLMEAAPGMVETECAGAQFCTDAPIQPVPYPPPPDGVPAVVPYSYGPAAYAAPTVMEPYYSPGMAVVAPTAGFWTWQMLPDGIIYQSYLAGTQEPRMAAVTYFEKDQGWIFEPTLGARVGIVRYGDTNERRPEGWQLDVEGAAFPRVNLEENWDLDSVDFRGGVPLTYGSGPWRTKFAYYHLSSHIGDEFLMRNPGFTRVNYTRDAIVLGESYYLNDDLRLYAEVGWAFRTRGGSEPWEFQFGVDYSPLRPGGAPFFAVNGHLMEEVDFGGQFVTQLGWQWRSARNTRILRTGVHYLNGQSTQKQFFRTHDEQIGLGMWYDF